ncbi:MAG: FAD binding domain-containing protein [Acidimicrobiales bacterium]
MIPAAFDYVRAESAEHAVRLLGEHGDEAKLLAGGHSLLPLMKLRLATPAVLIDVGRVRELSYVRDAGEHIAVGALTRHHDLERSELLEAEAPLLRHVAGQVGDPQVRHRGTIGGSVAHGDPASDLPAVLLAMRATLVAQGPTGAREIEVDDFFTGFLETALAPDEVLTEVRLPKHTGARWSFQKFNRRAQDWAVVGVACLQNTQTGIGLINMGAVPMRAAASEAAASSGASTADAAAVADQGTDPSDDVSASAGYRRHLVKVLTRRALEAVATTTS